jgi:hypothetical protein
VLSEAEQAPSPPFTLIFTILMLSIEMKSPHRTPRRKAFKITVGYDADAKISFVQDSDLPGLHIECSSFEELVKIAVGAAPDLIEANVDIWARKAVLDFIRPIETRIISVARAA